MKKSVFYLFFIGVLSFLLYSCKSTLGEKNATISTDAYAIAQGKILFNQYCSTCHNFHFDGIGPKLGGVTDSVPLIWIKDFIGNSNKMIEAGDPRATRLFAKHRTAMPPFLGLGDSSINNIIAYIHTRKAAVLSSIYQDREEVKNPIEDTIAMSELILVLKLITTFPTTGTAGMPPIARITKLDFEPHTSQSFVLDMNSTLYRLDGDQPVVYMDMFKLIGRFINQPGLSSGFANFAFHPEFSKNGLLYTAHTEPAATKPADFAFEDTLESALQFVISEWKADDPNKTTFEGVRRELFRIDMVSKAHGVQELAFNPTVKPGESDYGLLYISIGDAGAGENRYPFLLHDIRRAWGTLFRIDPKNKSPRSRPSKNGQYGIPLANPFVKDTNAIGEIYAYGFRNPHRITWTRNGQLLLSNIGHGDIETLNLIMPGQDYGWPYMEGNYMIDPYGDLSKIYRPIASDTIAKKISLPVAQFDHDEAKAIAGGYEYTGSIPALKGKFIFGDIPVGNIYYVHTRDIKAGKFATIYECHVSLNGEIIKLKDLNKTNRIELHFGKDAQGEIYIMTKADGKLYKIINATHAERSVELKTIKK